MSLQAPVPLPGAGFVGPQPKIATVERREWSRSPRDGVVARRRRDRSLRVRLSALHPPLIGGTELLLSRRPLAPKPQWGSPADAKAKASKKTHKPGAQQRAAGTNNTALFDIVKFSTASPEGRRRRRHEDADPARASCFGTLAPRHEATRAAAAALIPPARGRAACAFWHRSCARRTPRHRRIGRRPAGCANRSGETGRPGHRCRRSMSSAA